MNVSAVICILSVCLTADLKDGDFNAFDGYEHEISIIIV